MAKIKVMRPAFLKGAGEKMTASMPAEKRPTKRPMKMRKVCR